MNVSAPRYRQPASARKPIMDDRPPDFPHFPFLPGFEYLLPPMPQMYLLAWMQLYGRSIPSDFFVVWRSVAARNNEIWWPRRPTCADEMSCNRTRIALPPSPTLPPLKQPLTPAPPSKKSKNTKSKSEQGRKRVRRPRCSHAEKPAGACIINIEAPSRCPQSLPNPSSP